MKQTWNRRRSLKLIAAALGAGALGSSARALASISPASSEPIRITHVGALSGPSSGANLECLSGAQLYFDFVNAHRGVSGRQIKLERYDDEDDTNKGITLTRQTIEGRCAALFMYRRSPSVEAAIPLAVEAQIPFLAPQTGTNMITEPVKRNVFAIRASYRAEVSRVIQLLHSIGHRKMAVVYTDDTFGRDVLVGYHEEIRTLGAQSVALLKFENRQSDIAYLAKQAVASDASVWILASNPKAAASFCKTYKTQGGGAQLVALSNNSVRAFVDELGDLRKGVIVSQVMPSPYHSVSPTAREFNALAAKASGTQVSHGSFQGYISAKLLVEGLQRCKGRINPAVLTDALESIRNWDVGGGCVIDFGKNNRMGSSYVELSFLRADGRFLT